jgi:glyoxylase-like metal-dependent hydrolase (beta-lactamase superfamily II)
MEIARGIHRIEGVHGANSYLVFTDTGSAIVDTGMPGNENRILEYIRGAGIEPKRLGYIVLTHPDIDHSGSVAKLKGLTDAKVAIHEADAPRLAGEKRLKEVKGATGVLFAAMSPFIRFTPVEPDVLLRDSDRILDCTVIHTPGHTDGSISLYREKEAIFVGDALRTDSRGMPRLPSGSMTANMEQAKESVRKISTYQYAALLPGHGLPITKEASEVVADYVRKELAVE